MMNARTLDQIIYHLRSASAASARGCPDLARLHDTLARALMYRHGVGRYQARQTVAIDDAIARALSRGTGGDD